MRPGPLPPPLHWTPELLRALSDADRLIGRLAGEARALPNPHKLMRPFVRREAVFSSRIEGTETTLSELLAEEAGADVERDPADVAEVRNYVAALDLGMRRINARPLSLELVRELHARLMKGVRGGDRSPGQYRKVQNWLGRPGSRIEEATYVPPPPEEVPGCLADWERFLADRSLPPLVQIALLHYQFEAIHPFRDGNGRVGRLLITLFLVERAVLTTPLLYLSAFFEATRPDYYRHLLGVSRRGEWSEWTIYFLNGVARQSEDAVARAVRIDALVREWRERVAGSRSRLPAKLVDSLVANPYCLVKSVARREKVAFTTAQRAVLALERLRIVKQVNQSPRDRLYCATELLEILEEPANLAPQSMD